VRSDSSGDGIDGNYSASSAYGDGSSGGYFDGEFESSDPIRGDGSPEPATDAPLDMDGNGD
jgi:hypothetical protein